MSRALHGPALAQEVGQEEDDRPERVEFAALADPRTALDRRQEGFDLEWLRDDAVNAVRLRAFQVGRSDGSRDNENTLQGLGPVLFQEVEHGKSVDVRHFQVEKNRGRTSAFQVLDRFRGVGNGFDLEVTVQQRRHEGARGLVVVDERT